MALFPKYDYPAARAAGASPLQIFLFRAHLLLAKAYLVWTVLFVLGIIVYHATGKPKWLGDDVPRIFGYVFIVIWLASQAAIFCSHVFIRKMYLAAIPSFFLHGFMMLFPLLNIVVILSMAPELPGQPTPAGKHPQKKPQASPAGATDAG
jgi:hypothetical protein